MNQPQRPTSNLPVARANTLESMLEAMKPALTAELKTLDVGRFVSLALKSVQKNPGLLKCDPLSVVAAVRDAASVELEIDGVTGQAYIVPYKGKAQLQIGYKGFIRLAIQGGTVHTIRSGVVWEGDQFEMDLGTGTLKHVPVAPSKRAKDEKGNWIPVGAYAIPVWTNPSAPADFEWLWIEEIDAIQKRSPAGGDGPWVTDWEQMARKCPIRRLCGKRLLLSTKAQVIIEAEDRFEHGVIDVEPRPLPTTPPVDALEAIAAKGSPQVQPEPETQADDDAGALRTVYDVDIDIGPFSEWSGEVCNAPDLVLKGRTWQAISNSTGMERDDVLRALTKHVDSARRAQVEGSPVSTGWKRCVLTAEAMKKGELKEMAESF